MREAVEAGTHETAAAMVKAADALWDVQGGHDPTVAAGSTQRSRSPAPSSEKIGKKPFFGNTQFYYSMHSKSNGLVHNISINGR